MHTFFDQKHLDVDWIHIEGRKVVIGNIYVPPKNVKQYILNEVLEKLRSKDLMIIQDFNASDSMYDKHCKSNPKSGVDLGDIILIHGLHVATNTDHTYHQLPSCRNPGKGTIDLTLTRGFKSTSIKALKHGRNQY